MSEGMEWYIPLTILPGVGMLVLSTTSQMMSLSGEIERLLKEKENPFQHKIADLKIIQLTRLTRAATFLYLSAALFVLSGIWSAVSPFPKYGKFILFFGVGAVFFSLGFLIIYSYRTIQIRRMQHEH